MLLSLFEQLTPNSHTLSQSLKLYHRSPSLRKVTPVSISKRLTLFSEKVREKNKNWNCAFSCVSQIKYQSSDLSTRRWCKMTEIDLNYMQPHNFVNLLSYLKLLVFKEVKCDLFFMFCSWTIVTVEGWLWFKPIEI